ncbi:MULTISPECIES: DNA cytosine methyltransferase [Streptomyces]|uniref:DNA (cytosine-5-)-methyltransferase n=1 Tax=Streptomyces xinghaiensis TaxID=1038928 RepID=A0A3R7FIL1_9ACTN|nr:MULTISPECIES: DNA cytosine methyltransferase [Streptomyces]PQM22759.1 DNA cytosine methyltransferase [Streptomyces xinghaiensis]RKM97928.1 DNA cytosine methyltransferase [Streptomyces xinghaiensis]RNC73935.1 DNA cytosine methyltransferase [Streptomyces xinghaiensis]
MHTAKIVDLFAGPGGLDVAADRLGLPVVGIEWDEDACATRLAAGLRTIEGDVRAFRPSAQHESEVEARYKTELEHVRGANVLAGGPPCQTYTVAGTGAGRRALEQVLELAKRMAVCDDLQEISTELRKLDDVRTGLVLEPLWWALAAIKDGRPYDAIVLEQVPAALPVWKTMKEVLEGRDYSVEADILHTEEFGVPQTRRRAVLIARHKKVFGSDGTTKMPMSTHHRYRKGVARGVGDPTKQPWRTMDEVLADRTNFVMVSNYGTGGDPKARGRRGFDEPSATVTGKISRNRVLLKNTHHELPRLSHAEAGQLQTFPADYPWSGRAVAQQIGNAVPPRLGIHILAAALNIDDATRDGALESLDRDTFLGIPRETSLPDSYQPELA